MYRLLAQKFVQGHVEYLNRQVTVHAKRDEFSDKAVETRVLVDQRPIEPGYFVILTEAVIVPALGAAHLVSHQQHRHAGRQQGHSQEVLDLAVAQALDLRVSRWALDAAVPAEIVVRSVAVPLSVLLVVLAVVGNQIIEREAIVAGNKVDALLGFALLLLVDVGAPRQPEGHRTRSAVVAFEKGPHVIAKSPIPFLPAVADKAADLIKPGSVPRFGNQLDIGENGIGLDVPKYRRRSHRAAVLIA